MTTLRRSPVLAVSVAIGLIFGAAELLGGGSTGRAAIETAIPIGYGLLVTFLARRSETLSVLAGHPVDERWGQFNLEASAWALGATAIVALAALVVSNATNGDWAPYAFICSVMAVSYAGSLVVIRLRG